MGDEKQEASVSVQVQDVEPLAPPLHVGFIECIQVGDDLQLTLCDVDMKGIVGQIAEWKNGGERGTLHLTVQARPMQRVFLSKLAIVPLLGALQQAAGNLVMPRAEPKEPGQ